MSVRTVSTAQLNAVLNSLNALQKNAFFNRVGKVGFLAIVAKICLLVSGLGYGITYDYDASTPSKKNRLFAALGVLSFGGVFLAVARMVQLALKDNRIK